MSETYDLNPLALMVYGILSKHSYTLIQIGDTELTENTTDLMVSNSNSRFFS